MSPRFYGFLWILFFASAGILWLGSVFTLTVGIVFGFIMFGLVFAGMIERPLRQLIQGCPE